MLSYLTSGESHGPCLTAIVDGLPAGMPVKLEEINRHLQRRQKGHGRGGRQRIENDQAGIVSGVRHGLTLGSPVTLVIENRDWVNWAPIMDPVQKPPSDLTPKQRRLLEETTRPRPGHADLAGGIKLGRHDLRNVLERASARETAARVAAGSLVRQLLEHFGVRIASHVVRIGEVALGDDEHRPDVDQIAKLSEKSDVRCIDAAVSTRMKAAIKQAIKERDSLGGIAEVIVSGLPAGLGGFAQSRDRLDGRLAGALMSIQSVKGVEIGLGFAASSRRGSTAHDEIFYDPNGDPARKRFFRKTNHAGGLEGGITNGEDVIARVAVKPISTLMQPLQTVDVVTKHPATAMVERTDVCVVPAAAVICEAVAAMVFGEAFLHKFGSDNLVEIERNYRSFLECEY
ncbi:MAG: chorismate synthase [Candidatus Zixiibacteriota bacterium]